MRNKRLFIGLLVAILAFGLSGIAWAQTAGDPVGVGVEEIFIVAVTASTEDLMIAAADISAGAAPADDTGTLPAYLKYTVVPSGTSTYEITAYISSGSAPAGTQLKLATTPAAGQGTGLASTAVPLTALTAMDVVTLIPSCYTGTGLTDGAKVDYVLNITAVGSLVATAAADVNVLYTIQVTTI